MTEQLKYIIESLLFVSEGPLPLDKLKKLLETTETREIKQALDELTEEYAARGGGFTLKEIAGGYQMRTRPEFAPWIRRLVQPGTQRLSRASLETLAIIAYKQPVIRADIEFIRGVDCGGVLRLLLEKKLIRVLGRKEIPGRPMIYATTKQFLELFDLKDLKDLPSPKEIEALGNTHVLDMESAPDEEVLDDGDQDPLPIVIETENPDVHLWDNSGPDEIIKQKSEFSEPPEPGPEPPDVPDFPESPEGPGKDPSD